MEDKTSSGKRVRDDSDESSEIPEAKRFHANLFDILDDFDTAGGDRNPAGQDLASVMKSFEEEILFPDENDGGNPLPFPESESAESLPDLGYLLEASDDELGLPPPSSEENGKDGGDVLGVQPEAVGFGQLWGFDDDIPSYDALELGVPGEERINEEGSVVFEGLFDYPDVFSVPSDFSELSWRPEFLPAL